MNNVHGGAKTVTVLVDMTTYQSLYKAISWKITLSRPLSIAFIQK